MKARLAFYLHQSPPIHGASLVGDVISCYVAEKFPGASVRQLGLSRDLGSISSIKGYKLVQAIKLFMLICRDLICGRTGFFYTPAISRGGILKDIIVLLPLLILLWSPTKNSYFLLMHVHARGISEIRRRGAIWKFLVTLLFKKSDLLLLSPRHMEDFRDVGHRSSFICNNFSPVFVGKSDCAQLLKDGTRSDIKQYTYLSNLYRSKGVLEAIRLFAKSGETNSLLTIAGPIIDGEVSLREINDLIACLGLQGRVNYCGSVHGNEKDLLLSSTDVFLFPTRYEKEVFPLVLLEALSFGAYLISTNIGGIADIIDLDFVGQIIDEKISDTIAPEAMLTLENRTKRKVLASRRYSVETYFFKFQAIIEELLNDSKRR